MSQERLVRKTAAEPDPAKVRVCWIEDELERMPTNAKLSSLGDLFDIWHARGPEDLAEFLREHRACINEAKGNYRYDLPGAPFDLYIADWNLNDADDTRSQAHNAHAAGLFSSALAATEFSQHPAGIVTWTALFDEHRAEADLVRTLTAPAVAVAWARKDTLDLEPVFLPRLGASVVREALVRAACSGDVYLPLSEAAKIQEAVKPDDDLARAEARLTEWLENGTVRVHTGWGWRTFRAAALWADIYSGGSIEPAPLSFEKLRNLEHSLLALPELEEENPTNPRELVERWVGKFPVPEASMMRAADTAAAYHELSRSERSYTRHELNRLHAVLLKKGDNEAARQDFAAMLKRIGVPSITMPDEAAPSGAPGNAAKKKATKTKVEWPDGWACPHLLASGLTDEEKRLAACMLYLSETKLRLVMAHASLSDAGTDPDSWSDCDDGDTGKDLRRAEMNYLTGLAELQSSHMWSPPDVHKDADTAEGVRALIKSIERIETWEVPSFADALAELHRSELAVSEEDISRMIDPLPDTLKSSAISKGSKLGNALARLTPPLDLLGLITNKDNADANEKVDGLDARELRVLRDYCQEIDLPMPKYPAWLR